MQSFIRLAALLAVLECAQGQGLLPGASTLGVSSRAAALDQLYRGSRAFRRSYLVSAKVACSRQGTLCGSAAAQGTGDAYAQLELAASPYAYSSRNLSETNNVPLVAPPQDQGSCQTCTAFAVTAAAQTAVASQLQVDARLANVSVQALYFCSSLDDGKGPELGCSSGWKLIDALNKLKQQAPKLPLQNCLKYNPDAKELLSQSQLCKGACTTPNPLLQNGQFKFKALGSMWMAQRHIRRFGAVVSSMIVYDDFRDFFSKKANAQRVYQPPPGVKKAFGHAVALVGYNNEDEYWVVANSWGTGWGDGGFFRIAFGCCGILEEDGEAYGVEFSPASPSPALQLPLVPVPSSPNCYWYKARRGDYVSKVAYSLGISVDKMLLDNVEHIADLDAPLEGTQLLACNPRASSAAVVVPSPSPQPDQNQNVDKVIDPQLQALLQLKTLITTDGTALKAWNAESGGGQGYCNWRAITCNTAENGKEVIEAIELREDKGVKGLAGKLPWASVFAAWPGLKKLVIDRQPGITGSLPADYTKLSKLEHFQVTYCSLSGTIPESLASLKGLQVLRLYGNKLSGTVPEGLAALTGLQQLDLSFNQLTGTLPSSFGSLKGLGKLYLSDNLLKGSLPSNWAGMKALEVLELGNNKLTGPLPEQWQALASLRNLSVNDNPTLSPAAGVPASWMKGMTSLQKLDLTNCSLKGPLQAELLQSPRLTRLWLDNNALTGTLPDVAGVTALQLLALGDNHLRGTLPASWAKAFPALTALQLSGNDFKGIDLSVLSAVARLQVLYMVNCSLSGNISSVGMKLPKSLQQLYLGYNKFNGPLPDDLPKQLPLLEKLNIVSNQLQSTLPSSWAAWSQTMRGLAIFKNKLKGTLPAAWSRLTQLETFDVSENSLEGPLPAAYSSWSKCKWLNVDDNSLTGTLPPEYARLASLETLRVGHNKLHGTLPDEYSKLKRLQGISLVNNQLSGRLPASWSALPMELFGAGGNQFSGSVPAEWASWAPTIKEFYVWSNSELIGCLPLALAKPLRQFDAKNQIYDRTNIEGFC